MNSRISYIDILKGFGIFFVVFGHVTHIGEIRDYIWNFHMPLFFFVSGFLYKPSLSFRDFFLKRIKSIYIPYILFFFVTFTYWVLIERNVRGSEYSIWHQLIGLLYGTYEGNHLYFNGALWFLPCLFVTEIMFFPLGRIKNKIGILANILLFYIIGTILNLNEVNYLPLGLHTAFFAIVFYGFGYLAKQLPKYIIETTSAFQWLLIITCLSIQLLNKQYSSDISNASLPYLLIAIIGILLYLSLSIKIGHSKLIEYLGKNSLVIFAFQEPVYRAIIFIFSKITNIEIEYLRINVLYSIIISCFSILIIVPFIYIYNKIVKQLINRILW